MSDTIRGSSTLSITTGGSTFSAAATDVVYLTGSNVIMNIQNIGSASYEQVDFGDLNDCKCIFVKNNSTASLTCSFDAAGARPYATLAPAGGSISLDYLTFSPYMLSQSVFLKATQGAAEVLVLAMES